MAKFEEGFTYRWADPSFDPFEVVSRTAKTITVKNGSHSWRMLVRTDDYGNEYVRDSAAGKQNYSVFTSRATWVEHASISVGNRRYFVQYSGRSKGMQISRISPYDNTEYHWARQTEDGSEWKIISPSGKHVATFTPGNPAPKSLRSLYAEVAKRLVNFDAASNLTPHIDHT